jgi:hypothetical protein
MPVHGHRGSAQNALEIRTMPAQAETTNASPAAASISPNKKWL